VSKKQLAIEPGDAGSGKARHLSQPQDVASDPVPHRAKTVESQFHRIEYALSIVCGPQEHGPRARRRFDERVNIRVDTTIDARVAQKTRELLAEHVSS
jgi:hypothetical protein